MRTEDRSGKGRHKVVFRLVVCALVLAAGVAGMQTLAGLKEPPAEAPQQERALQVEVMTVRPADVPTRITGYGEVRVLDEMVVASEVSGKVEAIHPKLEPGEVIPIGDILFRIDDRDYQAAFQEASAAVEQIRSTVDRLEKQSAIDRERLGTLERNRELARAEYLRLKRLYEKDSVGTRSGVEAAEQQLNAAVDQAARLAQSIALYPLQIRETEHSLEAARARMDLARTRWERCVVRAPFTARVKTAAVEAGQYVAPGNALATLANDSVLEIRLPLDSRDARSWLLFRAERVEGGGAWFNRLEPVACRIRWTEDPDGPSWTGRLHRVVRFNEETRTLTVAVRVSGADAFSADDGSLPLVEGMFCSVEIPGRTLVGVYRLPRWAVTFDETVYVAKEGRLRTVPVTVARTQGEESLVAGGLEPGDRVITTRLVDPLEHSLLDIAGEERTDS
jgi:multidrug efflux pump subunit AcrA (membrane-fusion protein)